jgi:hypothetical protein
MKIHLFLLILIYAFLSGCSSQPTLTIEVSSDGTVSILQDHRAVSISQYYREIKGEHIQHYEVLDSNVTFTQTINGHHFEVLDGNVTYNGKEIARPEGSTLKIKQEGSSIFTYVDDKLVQEVRIDE